MAIYFGFQTFPDLGSGRSFELDNVTFNNLFPFFFQHFLLLWYNKMFQV